MKRILTVLLLLSAVAVCMRAEGLDTLRLSTLYTTHVIFAGELTYADLSNSRSVAAKIVEQNRAMLAIKAREAFSSTASVSALEADGTMHTFVLVYDEHPRSLVIDLRGVGPAHRTAERTSSQKGQSAPSLPALAGERQRVFHIGARSYGVRLLCENILVSGDDTYLVLSVLNRSTLGFECPDATFVVESRTRGRRSVSVERNLSPKSRWGAFNSAAGASSRAVYGFDKITLAPDQLLRVYLYETGGERNLLMTVRPRDINGARVFSSEKQPSVVQ